MESLEFGGEFFGTKHSLYVLVLSEKEKTQCLSLVRLVSNAQSARASILCR